MRDLVDNIQATVAMGEANSSRQQIKPLRHQ